MAPDFTFSRYQRLLLLLKRAGYRLLPLIDWLDEQPAEPCVILRHDVDRAPEKALEFARIEHEIGVKSSYYFRVVKESWEEDIITQIHQLGHEIGYHYEDVSLNNGELDKSWFHFRQSLWRLRLLAPVRTICQHGSPRSPFDNKTLWEHFDYRTLDIVCEPYLDLDFHQIFYITDAGRGWNRTASVLRDHVDSGFNIPVEDSLEIARHAVDGRLPRTVMLNIHPHNWASGTSNWWKILLWQGLKNQIKTGLNLVRNKG